MINSIRPAAAAIAMVTLFGVVGASEAFAAPCKSHKHAGYSGLQKSRIKAVRLSAHRWKAAVRHHDGRAFTSWGFARDKSVKVFRRGKLWGARASARPCMGPGSITSTTQ